MDLNHKIMSLFGYDWCGNSCPPGDEMSMHYGPIEDGEHIYVARIMEDGHELFLGSMEKWYFSMPKPDALRVAWFVIWRWWIRAEWFGLRRAIWYWALKRACNETRKHWPKEVE